MLYQEFSLINFHESFEPVPMNRPMKSTFLQIFLGTKQSALLQREVEQLSNCLCQRRQLQWTLNQGHQRCPAGCFYQKEKQSVKSFISQWFPTSASYSSNVKHKFIYENQKSLRIILFIIIQEKVNSMIKVVKYS